MKPFLQSGWPAFILAVAVIVGLWLNWPGKQTATPHPSVTTDTAYIYLDTAATRATRRADSLQKLADSARLGWQAALVQIDKYKKETGEAENFLTDVRNGAVIGNMSMAEAADYLLRFIYNNKGYGSK